MTTIHPAVVFLNGAAAMACLVAGVLFFSYRRDTGDRLFAFFAVGFWILGLNWAMLGIFAPVTEHRHWLHALRLVAFAFIAWGIADKNRQRRS